MADILLNTRPQHTNRLFADAAFAEKNWQQLFYRNNRSIVADILQPYSPICYMPGRQTLMIFTAKCVPFRLHSAKLSAMH